MGVDRQMISRQSSSIIIKWVVATVDFFFFKFRPVDKYLHAMELKLTGCVRITIFTNKRPILYKQTSRRNSDI